jgi:DNA-binding transcriptional LysR family regulator
MPSSSNQTETRVFGRGQIDGGLLSVTMAPMLAAHLPMPDLASFLRLHPKIELERLSSDGPADLTNREADVAIRVVYDRSFTALYFYGLREPDLFGGAFISSVLLAEWRGGAL